MIKIIGDVIIVFLMHSLPFEDKKELEKEFKKILQNLEDIYKFEMKGNYLINAYVDNIYGVILEIKKQSLDYYDYFDSIDMQINVIENEFLYKINDYFFIDEKVLEKIDLYLYKNNLYLKLNNKENLLNIIENSEIIYKKNEIIKNGKKINNML